MPRLQSSFQVCVYYIIIDYNATNVSFLSPGICKIEYKPDAPARDVLCFRHYNPQEVHLLLLFAMSISIDIRVVVLSMPVPSSRFSIHLVLRLVSPDPTHCPVALLNSGSGRLSVNTW